jgi:nucleoside-diphosphate-sugar epimerase
MIVGKGLIASGFNLSKTDYTNYIIFASGVSNSKETNDSEYNREKELLLKIINENKQLKIIYFSSVLVNKTKNKYYQNKLDIENIIKSNSDNYIIFRIPQVIGNNGNPKNLVNYIKNSIINKTEITINKNIKRSLLDVDDLVTIIDYCKDKVSCEILTISEVKKIKVFTLCNLIGKILKKKPILKIVNNAEYENWSVKNSKIINESIINIDKLTYNEKLLKKYIS